MGRDKAYIARMPDSRTAIFISHANPQDNDFTIWLGSRLSAIGYEVWADVLRLRGGYDWQRRLEDALRNKAVKVLLVGTSHGVDKQGVRNEIQIAHNISRQLGDSDFIIPLRLESFDAPFLIAHAQYIDFKGGWARGLAELTDTLDDTYHVPRVRNSATELQGYWRGAHMRLSRHVADKPETLVTNWLRLTSLPDELYFYDFKAGISLGKAQAAIKAASWPIVLEFPRFRGQLRACGLQSRSGVPFVVDG